MIELFFDYSTKNIFQVEEIVHTEKETYTITDRLGNGGNAVVHKCIHSTGKEYAIKFFLKPDPIKKKRFFQEIDILKQVQHEHIIQLVDEGIVPIKHKQIKEAPFIVMELANSNLYDFLKDKQLEYTDYIQQFIGLSFALSELHKIGIHRDIKPDNILVVGDKWAISDFGLFKYNNANTVQPLTEYGELVNPKTWLSPEGINSIFSNDTVNQSSDVFQLGCIFWFVVNGRYPLGNVYKEDWKGTKNLYEVIMKTLYHNSNQRIANGYNLYQQIQNASYEKENNNG